MKKIIGTTLSPLSLLFLVILLGVTGCRSKKVSTIGGEGALKAKLHSEILDDVITHELKYKTITTKGKASFNGKEFTTVFRLVKDEYIQASVRAPLIGIEVVRVDVTPEKAILIDRLGGRYAEVYFNESDISLLVAFNFYNLQALLTNQLFLAGKTKVTKSEYNSFTAMTFDNKFLLVARDKNKLSYNFAVDASDRIVSTSIKHTEKNMSLFWSYDQFVEDGEYIYPTNMSADVQIDKKKIKFGVSYSDLDVNTDFNLDKSIPSKYKKVDVKEILGAYMNLK